MTDIVKRLRNNEKLLPHMAAMLREEPLTSGLAKMVDEYVAESKEAAAEIERLRAAVAWVARWSIYKPSKVDGTAPAAETALRSIAWHPVIREAAAQDKRRAALDALLEEDGKLLFGEYNE